MTISTQITIPPPNYLRFNRQDCEIYYEYQKPKIAINSVIDAFQAAVLKIEWDNSTLDEYRTFSSSESTYQNIPDYFDRIKSPDSQELFKFFIEHQDLIDIAAFSCSEAVRQFDVDTELSLEIRDDDDEQYLALYVRQKHYQADLLKIIDDISSVFEDLLISSSGWFMITTDFHPPS